jgi:hypothetical protein
MKLRRLTLKPSPIHLAYLAWNSTKCSNGLMRHEKLAKFARRHYCIMNRCTTA